LIRPDLSIPGWLKLATTLPAPPVPGVVSRKRPVLVSAAAALAVASTRAINAWATSWRRHGAST
jgi:hypothetical protein